MKLYFILVIAFVTLSSSCKGESSVKTKAETKSTQLIEQETPLVTSSHNENLASEEIPVQLSNKEILDKPNAERNTKSVSKITASEKQPVPVEVSEPSNKKEIVVVKKEDTQGASSETDIEMEVISTEKNPTIKNKKERELIHDTWNKLLQQFVSASGKVDYTGLKKNIGELDTYLTNLSTHVPASSDVSMKAKAYWINVYNAFTVKLILDHYPLESITDLHSGKPWDHKWIKLGGVTYSLNNIEHDILRPKYKDGRIHFAVNCAAKSCPKLSNRAFTGQNVEKLLTSLTRSFVNNSAANTLSENKLSVSKIFDWYKVDFGDLVSFLNQYSKTKITSGATILYKDYDWALNSQ